MQYTLSSSSKAEVEARISDLQNELNSQTPSLSGIKDAMLALDGSLKMSQSTKYKSALSRIRTGDTKIRSHLLYPLSYQGAPKL